MWRSAFVALLLGGCATTSPDEVRVRWTRVSQDEVHHLCIQYQGHSPTVIGSNHACAIYNRDAGYCRIYATDFKGRLGMDSATDRQERALMASLGHELKHCFDGPWHN